MDYNGLLSLQINCFTSLDTSHIFVDVGLGFHVEFTRSEALNFIGNKEEQISSRIDEYTRLIASIKAQIKMVCMLTTLSPIRVNNVKTIEFCDNSLVSYRSVKELERSSSFRWNMNITNLH